MEWRHREDVFHSRKPQRHLHPDKYNMVTQLSRRVSSTWPLGGEHTELCDAVVKAAVGLTTPRRSVQFSPARSVQFSSAVDTAFQLGAGSTKTDGRRRPIPTLAQLPQRQHAMVAALIRTTFVQDSPQQAHRQWREKADTLRRRFRKPRELMHEAEEDVLASPDPLARLTEKIQRRGKSPIESTG